MRYGFAFILFLLGGLVHAADTVWTDHDADGNGRVHLYFFWSATCPHCLNAQPFIEDLPQRYPWLVLHSHQISRASNAAAQLYVDMARQLGQSANSVPAFLFCERMEVGFGKPENSGRALEQALIQCYDKHFPAAPPDSEIPPDHENLSGGEISPAIESTSEIELPGFGKVQAQNFSLPVFTLIIAGFDAFNPCAFFVLLFLLSLLVHARSRKRMLFIGGVFLFFSGAIYFMFMAAWLNLFLWLGELTLFTLLAGTLAIIFALINIKDYFWFKTGISLSIPEAAKPGLYQRIRGLLRADNLPALTVGTIVLAIAVNSYELLCTAGFPMVYTRVLTLSQLSPGQYYAYLLLYNIIYVIPLLVITLIFTFTLGSRKLSESEGRLLKLLSGLMMLGLGIILVVAPAALNNVWTAALLLLGAVFLSWGIHRFKLGAS
jgi:hypothetical protein